MRFLLLIPVLALASCATNVAPTGISYKEATSEYKAYIYNSNPRSHYGASHQ